MFATTCCCALMAARRGFTGGAAGGILARQERCDVNGTAGRSQAADRGSCGLPRTGGLRVRRDRDGRHGPGRLRPGSTVTISGDNTNGAGYAAGIGVDVVVSGPNGWTSGCSATVVTDGTWACQVTLDADPAIAVGDYSYTATSVDIDGISITETGTFTDDLLSPTLTLQVVPSSIPASPSPSVSLQGRLTSLVYKCTGTFGGGCGFHQVGVPGVAVGVYSPWNWGVTAWTNADGYYATTVGCAGYCMVPTTPGYYTYLAQYPGAPTAYGYLTVYPVSHAPQGIDSTITVNAGGSYWFEPMTSGSRTPWTRPPTTSRPSCSPRCRSPASSSSTIAWRRRARSSASRICRHGTCGTRPCPERPARPTQPSRSRCRTTAARRTAARTSIPTAATMTIDVIVPRIPTETSVSTTPNTPAVDSTVQLVAMIYPDETGDVGPTGR
jgi:hypothetical protein